MKKITLLLSIIFPLFLFSQNPYTFNGSYSLTGNTSFPTAFSGLGSGNCGNGASQTIIINGDLNLNGRTLELRNVNLIVYGNLNGSGSIITCSTNSTYCVRGAIQNNPTISVTRNYDCVPLTCIKTWNGSASTNWNVANNWTPSGVPTINCDVLINNTVACIITTNNAVAKSITISNTGSLNINSSGIARVKGKIEVASTANFTLENASSLIQIDDVANIGNITMKRTTSITKMDYVYWSSPVESFNVSNVSPNSSLIYKWIPTITTNFNGFGNWSGASNEIMAKGKGYIVRGPNNFDITVPQNFTAIFTGKANNGTILTPIARGTYSGANYFNGGNKVTNDDDNWNLIGNPYPSAIDAVKFLTANTDLDGFVRVWMHSTPISNSNQNPFYGSFVYNYSSSDYLAINGTGTSRPGALSVVGAGQGFFVKMRDNSPSTSGNATFTNNMRGTTVANNQFFRNSEASNTDETTEKHRIWLNLVHPTQVASSMLIGYVSDATNGVDRIFDAETKLKSDFELYSVVEGQFFTIQGRALPFTSQDEIPLGFSADQTGIYTFGLTAVDGLFETDQAIYIQDLQLGITHNLKESPYSFTTEAGNYNNRFILKFSNETLGNNDFTIDNTVVYANDAINIESNEVIKEVLVYDTLGRLIFHNSKVNSNKYRESQILKSNSPLVIQVILDNNIKISKKIIY
ncbi:T9SS sorting signal type C domain-containing protein [Flavobacterium proteolyticum]|uniref:T9SS sorting signal type C domain-containing protein n=1 Tax=Flavobacterium proteolyticum TaxID=2911683 RepID=A0ABR9WRS4_9FLAO|nr:T9SS sorting signal type C domain-containing protein [Flavobacterium proteolyticum]MBE9575184.1 T9SS sorting signal type C domain-containing protein [Flavobacterium proteolyticum]